MSAEDGWAGGGRVPLDRIQDLTHPDALRKALGRIARVDRAPFESGGFSGATLEWAHVIFEGGATRSFVLKTARLRDDWFSQRTADPVGREAALLGEPALAAVWESFGCPYVAFALQDGEIGMLMDDLSDHLFPDERKPIQSASEDRIVDAMVSMHARFWNTEARMPRLLGCADYLGMMGPGDHEQDAIAPPPEGIRQAMRDGWDAALDALPSTTADYVSRPAGDLAEPCRDVPMTLVHGDLKIANLAALPDGRVAAVDWAFVGVAPCTFDLGWYLAVNASRLTRSKEEFALHFRRRLEIARGAALRDVLWDRMLAAGLLCGAMMLLWSKGGALRAGRDGAKEEWDWWEGHLRRIHADWG